MRMQQQQQQQGAKGQESPPRLLLIAGDHGLRERMEWDGIGWVDCSGLRVWILQPREEWLMTGTDAPDTSLSPCVLE